MDSSLLCNRHWLQTPRCPPTCKILSSLWCQWCSQTTTNSSSKWTTRTCRWLVWCNPCSRCQRFSHHMLSQLLSNKRPLLPKSVSMFKIQNQTIKTKTWWSILLRTVQMSTWVLMATKTKTWQSTTKITRSRRRKTQTQSPKRLRPQRTVQLIQIKSSIINCSPIAMECKAETIMQWLATRWTNRRVKTWWWAMSSLWVAHLWIPLLKTVWTTTWTWTVAMGDRLTMECRCRPNQRAKARVKKRLPRIRPFKLWMPCSVKTIQSTKRPETSLLWQRSKNLRAVRVQITKDWKETN